MPFREVVDALEAPPRTADHPPVSSSTRRRSSSRTSPTTWSPSAPPAHGPSCPWHEQSTDVAQLRSRPSSSCQRYREPPGPGACAERRPTGQGHDATRVRPTRTVIAGPKGPCHRRPRKPGQFDRELHSSCDRATPRSFQCAPRRRTSADGQPAGRRSACLCTKCRDSVAATDMRCCVPWTRGVGLQRTDVPPTNSGPTTRQTMQGRDRVEPRHLRARRSTGQGIKIERRQGRCDTLRRPSAHRVGRVSGSSDVGSPLDLVVGRKVSSPVLHVPDAARTRRHVTPSRPKRQRDHCLRYIDRSNAGQTKKATKLPLGDTARLMQALQQRRARHPPRPACALFTPVFHSQGRMLFTWARPQPDFPPVRRVSGVAAAPQPSNALGQHWNPFIAIGIGQQPIASLVAQAHSSGPCLPSHISEISFTRLRYSPADRQSSSFYDSYLDPTLSFAR